MKCEKVFALSSRQTCLYAKQKHVSMALHNAKKQKLKCQQATDIKKEAK